MLPDDVTNMKLVRQVDLGFDPRGVTCTDDNRILVANHSEPGKVHIYNMEGQELITIQPPGIKGAAWDVCCNISNIYIAENCGPGNTRHVYIHDLQGAHVKLSRLLTNVLVE